MKHVSSPWLSFLFRCFKANLEKTKHVFLCSLLYLFTTERPRASAGVWKEGWMENGNDNRIPFALHPTNTPQPEERPNNLAVQPGVWAAFASRRDIQKVSCAASGATDRCWNFELLRRCRKQTSSCSISFLLRYFKGWSVKKETGRVEGKSLQGNPKLNGNASTEVWDTA